MESLIQRGSGNSSLSLSTIAMYAGIGAASIYAISKVFESLREIDGDDPEDQQGRDIKPAGIYNEGNTCFVNSLLQALSSLKSFQELLKETASHFRGLATPNEELILELSSVLDKINKASESISVGRLLSLIEEIKEGLINLEQQDAHELYAAIISCMDTTLSKQKNLDLSASFRLEEEDNLFENPLVGYLKSSTICTTCKTETSVKIDPFYDLSLDISKIYVVNVKSALAEFEREEKIDHWTCSNCSIQRHCKKIRKAIDNLKGKNKEKLSFIGEAIIDFLQQTSLEENQIKEVNLELQNLVKNYIKEYQMMGDDPERDTIFREMEGEESSILKRTIITKYPKILVIHMKQLVVHPYTGEIVLLKKHIGFDESLEIPIKNKTKSYRLTGLLTHIGNQSFGHYMSFRRLNRESDQWYMMNDSSSQKTEWKMVQQSRAYMLFYETD